MIFIEYGERLAEEKYATGTKYFMPLDRVYGLPYSLEEAENRGVFLDSIPEPQQIEGKTPVMYINPNTKEIYYEYVDYEEPVVIDEKAVINKRLEKLEEAINELILGGM